MAERWVLDPSAVADNRTELEITDWINVKGVDLGDAAIQTYMADQAIGSTPVDYRIPNRTIQIPLILKDVQQGAVTTTFAEIGAQLQQKVARFHAEGGWVMREIDGTALYADVVNATLKRGGSWLAAFQGVDVDAVLTLECLPDFYGDEVQLDTISGSGYVTEVLNEGSAQAVIIGDYPARCRIKITDTSGHDQNGILWAFRSRHYSSDAKLFYEMERMQLIAPAAGTVTAGAYGGTAVRRALSGTSSVDAILQLMPGSATFFTHVGSYRAWLRCSSTAAVSPEITLNWGVSGVFSLSQANQPGTLLANTDPFLVDLGAVNLPEQPPSAGIQSWWGQIGALGGSAGDVLLADALWLQPLDESAGRVTWQPALAGSAIAQLRTDGMIREDFDYPGVYAPIANVIGDLPRIPVSGFEKRPVELFLKPTRENFVDNGADNGIDSFTATVYYRPCWLFSPS